MNFNFDFAPFPFSDNWINVDFSPVIFLTYLKRTPPHIAMVFNHRYYSYDLLKFDTKIPLNKVLNYFDKKNEPVLGIVLKKHPVYSIEHMEEIYSLWKPNENHPQTCLSPILEFMSMFYPLSNDKNYRPNIPNFLNLLLQTSYIDKIIFYKFNNEKRVIEIQNYNADETKKLIEGFYVPERK